MAAAERKRRAARERAPKNGAGANGTVTMQDLEPLLNALKANKDGVQGVRLSTRKAGIVGELVRRFDGRIWVDSREGEGSTFHVELPTAAAKRKRTAVAT